MHNETSALDSPSGARRMQLRYGFNEVYGWHAFAEGPHRALIQRRMRLMGTAVVRLFVFDQPVPDPFKDWQHFAACLQAVLDVGAKPMVTFAKYHPPYDDADNIARFVARCSEIVWSCGEQWGGEEVKDWYWCVWNEPNNPIVGGDITFEQYLRAFRAVGAAVLEQLGPHLGRRKALIGGPAIDTTHRGYWMDWIARLVAEADERMLAFVSWHRYGDWRPAVPSASLDLEMWGAPDAPTGALFEALLMTHTPEYEARARGVARLLGGRDILNVCGELNAISHHEKYYTLGLNQNAFGAAYYASALVHLLRGGADLEMRWTGTANADDAYGLMTMEGKPTPACLAKQLFAQNVRYGDMVAFPDLRDPHLDAVVAWNDDGRFGAVFVNTSAEPRALVPADWDGRLQDCREVLRLDSGTGNRVVRERFGGTVRIDGYGIAVVSNAADATEWD